MSTIMSLDYLYLMDRVIDSNGAISYVAGVDPAKIKAALGFEVTQLDVASTVFPFASYTHDAYVFGITIFPPSLSQSVIFSNAAIFIPLFLFP